MSYCMRKNEPTDTEHCLCCEYCRPPGEREYSTMCPDEMTSIALHDLLLQANRRRKRAERTVRLLRGRLMRTGDDALKAIDSRQRTIEEQWEVMRELQRRGLVSTEDLEAVLRDVMHVGRFRFKDGEGE